MIGISEHERNRAEDRREERKPGSDGDCGHDWVDVYYGSECSKCGLFYPDGCAPWEDESGI